MKNITANRGVELINKHVGSCLRTRRTIYGLTQQSLAEGVGLSFQQIQKYESATNRIAASTLYRLARTLNMRPGAFYEDMALYFDPDTEAWRTDLLSGPGKNPANRRETLELVKAYGAISSPAQRLAFAALVSVFAGADEGTSSTS